MAPHTPGPWQTDPDAEHQCVLGPDGVMVADCFIIDVAWSRTGEECTANARLVAAAPEMLAELGGAVTDLEFAVALAGRSHPDRAREISLRLVRMRAALARTSAPSGEPGR